MPLADWAMAFGGPLFRNRLEPDILSRIDEYWDHFSGALTKLGMKGWHWQS